MNDVTIGIIGGSGLYQMEGLLVLDERKVETPFGDPSDSYVIGEIDGVRVAFLSRHGRGHRLTPSELNYRANLFGFKLLGVHTILSSSPTSSSTGRGIVPTPFSATESSRTSASAIRSVPARRPR